MSHLTRLFRIDDLSSCQTLSPPAQPAYVAREGKGKATRLTVDPLPVASRISQPGKESLRASRLPNCVPDDAKTSVAQ